MKLLSIDPGNTESAWLLYNTETRQPISHAKQDNNTVIGIIRNCETSINRPDDCVIENVACYGMAVGKEVFETVKWIGRFEEAWQGVSRGLYPHVLYRREIKHHLCNSVKAKDSNVRQVLIDLYGGKAKALGLKASPGPLYGISKDRWSALAIAVTFADTKLVAAGDGREGM